MLRFPTLALAALTFKKINAAQLSVIKTAVCALKPYELNNRGTVFTYA